MEWKKKQGNEGEEKAVEYLWNKEYKILERNWRCGHWEIDIIAEKDGILVFVEVKTWSGNMVAREIVSERQMRTLIQAAECYLQRQSRIMECRFDVILVRRVYSLYNIEHIENAFR